MQFLKSAIGKEGKGDKSVSNAGNSKMFNKSKSQSIWTLDPEDNEEQEAKVKKEKRIELMLESAMRDAFTKQNNFSEIVYYEIIEFIQSSIINQGEIQCLLLIQKKSHDLQDAQQAKFKQFAVLFYQMLVKRIKKLKKKQKKDQLQQFDKIIKSNNFKKKGKVQFINEDCDKKNHLEVQQNNLERRKKSREHRNSGNYNSKDDGSSRLNGSSGSSEGKLSNLLSPKTGTKKKDKQQNHKTMKANEQSVSFSAVFSQSVAVKQRRTKEDKVIQVKKDKQSTKMKKQLDKNEDQDDGTKDEAFIFYRPKNGKKK